MFPFSRSHPIRYIGNTIEKSTNTIIKSGLATVQLTESPLGGCRESVEWNINSSSHCGVCMESLGVQSPAHDDDVIALWTDGSR